MFIGNFGHVAEMNFFRAIRSDKNGIQENNFKLGDVVLLKEDFRRNKWPMARVVKIEPAVRGVEF